MDVAKFKDLVEEKRHKELSGSLKAILIELQKDKKDDSVKNAIDKQSQSIQSFVNAINNLPKPQKQDNPSVTVNTDNTEIVDSIKSMANDIITNLTVLQTLIISKPKEWNFDVKRNNFGYIENIKAKEA